jgi:membrane fusion protein (multidrug efflux system)
MNRTMNNRTANNTMKKRMRIMLICAGILFGGIFLYKAAQVFLFKRFMASNQAPIVTVSAMKVGYTLWSAELKASSSVRAIRGINVTTELAGMVQKIYFKPGTLVEQGEMLVQLNADSDVALLNSLKASAELAKTVYDRDKAQYAIKAISKASLDFDAADLKSKQAQVAQQAAIVNKKTIRAPFSGRLGISAINPGQYLNPGDKIVTLQELDPVFVDFAVPQQALVKLKTGQDVTVTVDAFPGKKFTGKITTIDPIVDASTRNVKIEATVANSSLEIVPGMFVSTVVHIGEPQKYLTLPQTAVTFNSYGDIIYLVKETLDKNKKDKVLTVTQTFVTTGETRGDQVAILKGLKEGDLVVTSGQLKLNNGSRIVIDNKVVPANNPAPMPVDE